MKLIGKTVVVTGCGSGIGRQLVLQLLNEGNRVAAIDVNQASLEETKKLAGTNGEGLSMHIADITDRTAVCSLPESIDEIHKSIDVLINNAGIIQPFVPFNELSYEQIKRVIDINVYGPIRAKLTSSMSQVWADFCRYRGSPSTVRPRLP